MKDNLIRYIFNSSEFETLREFIDSPNSLLSAYRTSVSKFLLIADEDGKTNNDRIYEAYTFEQKEKYKVENSINALDKINVGTELLIPKDEVNAEILSIVGKNQFLEQKPFAGFWADKLLELQNDPLYNPVEKINLNNETLSLSTTQCKVWIWCRALKKVLNVSPFVSNLNTTVQQSGSFNIELQSMLDLSDVEYMDDEVFFNFPLRNSSGENMPFFSKYLQQNDLVFIRFEELFIEQSNSLSNQNNFEIPNSQLPNQIYDMIGLIDTVTDSMVYKGIDSSVLVSGQDFMKLLAKDTSYFFPQLSVSGEKELSVSRGGTSDRQAKRLIVDQKIYSLFTMGFRSIQDTLGFIVNKLSSLGILTDNDDVLRFFQNKSQAYTVSGTDNKYIDSVDVQGVWGIVNMFVDSVLADRRVADDSLIQPQGTMFDQFTKICQAPFVEFFGDTYGDRYNLIVRQPPFTKSAVLSFIENNTIIDIEDYETKRLDWNETYFSWFQLTPKANLVGGEISMAPDLIPIVHFPEFAEIFGNDSLQHQHNYISQYAQLGPGASEGRNKVREAIVNDLMYLVESNIYLPFTRKGSITLPYGDRRIKKGTFVRFKPTGEIFYVDSVTNNLSCGNTSVDRTTTINVSRGMVEKYIKGVEIGSSQSVSATGDITGDIATGGVLPEFTVSVAKRIKYGYFNIVNTELIKSVLIEGISGSKKTKSVFKTNFSTNKEVFDFFLHRRQFD